MKTKLRELKGKIDKPTIIAGDFNFPPSAINTKNTENLNIINYLELLIGNYIE